MPESETLSTYTAALAAYRADPSPATYKAFRTAADAMESAMAGTTRQGRVEAGMEPDVYPHEVAELRMARVRR